MHADAVQVAEPRPVKGARWSFDTDRGVQRTALRRGDRVSQRPLWLWLYTSFYLAVSVGPGRNGQRPLGRLKERSNDLASDLDLAWR